MIARTIVKRLFSRAPALCLAALFALALCGSASRTSFAAAPDTEHAADAVHAAPLSVTEEDPHMAGTRIEPPLNEYEDRIEEFEKEDRSLVCREQLTNSLAIQLTSFLIHTIMWPLS